MQKVNRICLDNNHTFFFCLKDVVDFINSENTKSNSKHSLFDHFKRNLFLNCTIPRFDPRNGLLGLKSALDMNGRSSSGVTVTGVYSNSIGGGKSKYSSFKINDLLIVNSIPDDDIQHPMNMENSTITQHSTSYVPESSKIKSELKISSKTCSDLEKRKYSKQNEIDNQHKNILVPSIGCKIFFIYLNYSSAIILSSWQYIINESHSTII
jgi:hypothetical protein